MTVRQQFAMVPIDQITIAPNVRRDPGDVADLAASIRKYGLLEPIVGCNSEDRTTVDLIMGQRRLEACRLAGLTEIPCLLRARPPERDRLLMQLAENLDRKDMSPIDEAIAFDALKKTGMTQLAISKAVGRSDYHVSARCQLLELPDCVRVAVDIGWLPANSALQIPRSLLDDQQGIVRLAQAVRGGSASVRAWVLDESKRQGFTSGLVRKYRTTRDIPLHIESYELAKRAAREAGIGTRDWIENAIGMMAKAEDVA